MPTDTFHNLPTERRQRVIDAALDEFAAWPFEAASVNRIVQGADIAKGSFYQYFEDLFDLYRWLILEHLAGEKMRFIQARDSTGTDPADGDLFDQLSWMALQGIRWGMARPRSAACARQLWAPATSGPIKALQDELRQQTHAGMVHMLRAGQAQGVVRAELSVDAAAGVVAAMLREGLDNAMRQRLGFTILDLCASPELARDTDLAQVQAVVTQVMDLLRRAVGTGVDGGRISLDELEQARWGEE